jgi:hypothetical protein
MESGGLLSVWSGVKQPIRRSFGTIPILVRAIFIFTL